MSKVALVASALVVLLHFLLVRHAADSHLAHVLLGGHASWDAILLAVALVVLRVVAVVVVPGVVLAALTTLVAQRVGSSSGAGISVAGAAGASSVGRGRK